MDVTVETQCSRCNRKEERRVSLEEAQQMEAANNTRAEHQEGLVTQFEDALSANIKLAPDFVLIRRTPGKKRGFDIRVLNELCHIPDAKRNKGCTARVEVLVKEIFMENPKPESKGKGKGKGKGKNKGDGKDDPGGEGGGK